MRRNEGRGYREEGGVAEEAEEAEEALRKERMMKTTNKKGGERKTAGPYLCIFQAQRGRRWIKSPQIGGPTRQLSMQSDAEKGPETIAREQLKEEKKGGNDTKDAKKDDKDQNKEGRGSLCPTGVFVVCV